MKVNNIKIGVRLGISFGIILILMIVMGGESYLNINSITDETVKMLQTDARVAEYTARARANVNAMRRYEKDAYINIDNHEKVKGYLEKWTKEYDGGLEKIVLTEKILKDPKALETIKLMKKHLADYSAGFRKSMDMILKEELTTASGANKFIGKYKNEVHALEKEAKEMAYDATDEMHKVDKVVISNASSAIRMILIFAGIAIILSVLISIIITRSITGPIEKSLGFARKLSVGDLTARTGLIQGDELGVFAKALDDSADNLEQLVSNVILASNNLAQAVQQISAGNQNLSQRTSEQASSLEEIASTVEEASATTNQNTQNAGKANQLASNSLNVAEEGGTVSKEAVHGINEISEVSKKIGDITSVINEISFQTNLLALNAAVEAARAGEAGRGFAVVAGEIRNLAQRSGNAAKEIEELIKDTVSKIENGSSLVIKSGNSLDEIIKAIEDVSNIVGEITASSNEQKQGMDQLTTAVSELDNMTQQNAALVEETASASEEMANQAQELLGMTDSFTVDTGGDMKKKQYTSYSKGLHKENGDPAGSGEKKKNVPAHEIHAKSEGNIKDAMAEEGFEEF